MVTNFCSYSHHGIFKHSLAINFLLLRFTNIVSLLLRKVYKLMPLVKFFIRGQWTVLENFCSTLQSFFIHSSFLSLYLIVSWGLCVKICTAFAAIDGIDCLDQKTNQNIHLFVVFNDQVNSPGFELQRQTLPREEREWSFDSWLLRIKFHDVVI